MLLILFINKETNHKLERTDKFDIKNKNFFTKEGSISKIERQHTKMIGRRYLSHIQLTINIQGYVQNSFRPVRKRQLKKGKMNKQYSPSGK